MSAAVALARLSRERCAFRSRSLVWIEAAATVSGSEDASSAWRRQGEGEGKGEGWGWGWGWG